VGSLARWTKERLDLEYGSMPQNSGGSAERWILLAIRFGDELPEINGKRIEIPLGRAIPILQIGKYTQGNAIPRLQKWELFTVDSTKGLLCLGP
jgi:hypothetical protein